MVTRVLEEDENGDMYIPLGEELCNELNWKIGDTLSWHDNEDGSFTVSKKLNTKIVLVDTIQTFRIRYAVEIPDDAPDEWALDTVTMEEAVQFSQESLGENIVSHRVITQMEFLKQYHKDNDYVSSWDDDLCFKNGLTKWESS